MRAVLAGGGTGGHVIPALAIAQELRARYDAKVVFIGTARGIENRLVPAAGFELRLVEIGALKSVSIATRLRTLFSLPRAVLRCVHYFQEFRPEVVVGVGGYASGPAMLAAAMTGVPTLAFEPNFVPGFANRIAGMMAVAGAVQFEETARYFRRARVTGVPVRAAFFRAQRSLTTPAAVTCDPRFPGERRPNLLVFGGSQGAHAVNEALIASLERFHHELPNLVIVHQTGERDYERVAAAYLHSGISAEIYPFIDNMPEAFANADLLLCRSGASTVAEVTAAGKPAIFVPFPHATDDHQRRNAEALVRSGAALLVPESQLTPERLVSTVKQLLCENRDQLLRMAEAARKLAHPDAAAEIARMAARLAGCPERNAQAAH